MKTAFFFLILLAGAGLYSQEKGDQIIGNWITENGEGIVEVYKENGRYFGKLVWLSKPNDEEGNPRLDAKNSQNGLRTRGLIGILILNSFVYNSDERTWANGKVYDPNMGHTADGVLTLQSKDVLKVKGYVGFKWISKSQIWKRTTTKQLFP